MKIAILNTSDKIGGAAKAAYRLHSELRKLHFESRMFVQNRLTSNTTVVTHKNKISSGIGFEKIRRHIDSLPIHLHRFRKPTDWDIQWLPLAIRKDLSSFSADIVNLHWICSGFLPIAELKRFHNPIVWTLHDSWPFTGGCHVELDCTRYRGRCGRCPQLGSNIENDLSRWIWKRKKWHWRNISLTLVSPSKWLAERAKNSSLFREVPLHIIPNGVDLDVFRPIDQKIARDLLNLPKSKHLIACGAMKISSDTNKGLQYFQAALQWLKAKEKTEKIEILLFGDHNPTIMQELKLPVHSRGVLYDEISMALIYAAADVVVVPSEQENLPFSVMEAMACGRPIVAFNVGGIGEMVSHGISGYLAEPYDIQDLARGIEFCLKSYSHWKVLGASCRDEAVKKFSLDLMSKRYLALYRDLVTSYRYH